MDEARTRSICKVKQDGHIVNKAAYRVIGIDLDLITTFKLICSCHMTFFVVNNGKQLSHDKNISFPDFLPNQLPCCSLQIKKPLIGTSSA